MIERREQTASPEDPKALYSQLLQYYYLVPVFSLELEGDGTMSIVSPMSPVLGNAFGNEILPNIQRRNNSQLLPRLTQGLTKLLAKSPTSDIFQGVIVKSYKSTFKVGRLKDTDDPAEQVIRKLVHSQFRNFEFADILDLEDDNSLGIYDPERAAQMEVKAYLGKVHYELGLGKRIRQNIPGNIRQGVVEESSVSQSLKQWREELERRGLGASL